MISCGRKRPVVLAGEQMYVTHTAALEVIIQQLRVDGLLKSICVQCQALRFGKLTSSI